MANRFRKLTTQTSFFVSPGDASEDGDFVALRQLREKKRESLKSAASKSSLDTVDESPTRRVSQNDININQSHFESSNPKEVLRNKLFKYLEEGKDEEVKKCIENNVPVNIGDLKTDAYRRPTTRENVLHVAFGYKRIELARYIIERLSDTGLDLLVQNFDVNLAAAHGVKNVAHLATELHDLSLVKLIVSKIKNKDRLLKSLNEESPVQIEGQRPRTFPCLHLAAFHGFTDLVDFYLDCGVTVNHLNAKKDTALLWAARWGHVDTVKSLLKRGADPSIENDKGSTALYWAVRYGHAETIQVLLTQGKANPHQTRKLGLVAPIVLASALGYDDIVKILLDNGANVNHMIRGKEMPVHHAAREGHVTVLKTLINRGADFDKTDERGDTALLLGAKFGHPKVVQTLIQSGANMKQKNLLGEDIWVHAVNNSKEFSATLIQTLLDIGLLEPEQSNKDLIRIKCSKSPLFHAAMAGECGKIEHFLSLKLDPAEPDEDGNTFLMVAALYDQHEVIKKFYKLANIDTQNLKGNTALHIACLQGYHDTITVLIDKKAKANIKNKNGETALHVAAYSKTIRPQTVKKLINHVIKTNAWESLNVPDAEGKNPLHIAAKFAPPEILWEFRFVRYKDLDHEGNNAIHAAVRPKHEEAFLVMMDIYDTMKRDADINQQNNQEESALHLAAMECFGDGVKKLILYGADLSLQDANGDTVLHRLTRASVKDRDHAEEYLEIFDIVMNEAIKWWCIKRFQDFPDDKVEIKQIKRKAILELTKHIYNKSDLSVLSLACTLGASEVIQKLTQMKDVLYFEIEKGKGKPSTKRYDVTHLTPLTNNSVTGLCRNTRVVPRPSCIEWLLSADKLENASFILDLPPMAYIERSYSSIAAWTYVLIMALHLIHMIVFSYCGVHIQDYRRTNATSHDINVSKTMFYFTAIEPAFIIIYFTYELVKNWCLGEKTVKSKLKRGRANTLESIINPLGTFFSVAYAVLVLVWIILYSIGNVYQTYFLSVSLGTGWIVTIVFTKGFKPVHYFWKMIQNMMIRDISKFLFVYLFVLIGFSFAFHVTFQVSSDVVEDFKNPLYTMFLMFNLMLGMDEIFTDGFETNMAKAGYTTIFPKIIYILYMILATIVLLNLLIAMMNDSYSATLKRQQLLWRIESVQLGVNIEKMLPFTNWLFSRIKLHHGLVVPSEDKTEEMVWYIEVSSASMEKIESTTLMDKETELINHLNNRLTTLDNKLSEQMKTFQNTLQEMQSMLKKQAERSPE